MTNRHTNWTREQIALLFEYWPTTSSREIAKMLNRRFGTKYTRNAVLGKCFRIGLVKPEQPSLPRMSKVVPPRRVPPPKPVRLKIVKEVKRAPPPLVVIPQSAWEPLPDTSPINIVSLKSVTCRWPVDVVDASEQMFCGAKCDYRYCPTHTAVGTRATQTSSKLYIRSLRQYA